VTDHGKPRLLLCDDEPVLLMVMGDLLSQTYSVTRVESGHGAIALLQSDDFDAIVLDWHMDGGNGADVYRWIIANKPHAADRVVFLSGWEGDDAEAVAPGRPMVRKGQDSAALTKILKEIVRQVRGSGAHILPT